jgi:hypothetical protein
MRFIGKTPRPQFRVIVLNGYAVAATSVFTGLRKAAFGDEGKLRLPRVGLRWIFLGHRIYEISFGLGWERNDRWSLRF